jgi:hypothetical protein
MGTDLVRVDLGEATARLYERLLAIVARATTARPALGRIVLGLICGAYHDYRAMAPMPKADLVEALRAVQDGARVRRKIGELVGEIIAGRFADDETEARRWSEHEAPPPIPLPTPTLAPPAPLSERQRTVLAWILRYREVYGRSPTGKEIGSGVGIAPKKVGRTLRQLEAKRAVAMLDGPVPTRAP